MSKFGEYLKELRGKKSIREVAKETGISHTYLSTLEKGFDPRTNKPRTPTPETINKLAAYYNVPNGDLMIKAGFDPIEYMDFISEYTPKIIPYTDIHGMLSSKEVAYYKGKLLTVEQKELALKLLDALFTANQ